MRTFTVSGPGIYLRKGEEMGMFQMGSTIVLMFECPLNTSLGVEPGQKVKVGESLLKE